GERAKLVSQRAQVLEAGGNLLQRSAQKAEPAADRLEVDVVLEKDARHALVRAGILGERRVFELQHIDAARLQLAVNQPVEIVALEFPHGVRKDRAQIFCASLEAHEEFS